ncbi:Uncharacterised protein [Klebsiella pneumoniae]|uniref:hypothetical protein n=1 Tax=Klebsiella oxytoca TaxID=571 RepID=UPI000F71B178|nr:hypothetical protein [Klebsiella oxytoca]VEB98196.1 Uncharacterised protein [Klebsiella pneumoniae]
MTWLGIPYPSSNSSFLDSGILTLGKLPTVVVDSGFGWDTVSASILGAIIGAAIPAAISYYAISNSAKTMKDDREEHAVYAKEQLRAQLVSSSRQLWINELRDSAAKYISVANKLNNLQILITNEFRKDEQKDDAYYREIRMEATNIKSDLTFFKAKIEMLLNPNEHESDAVIIAMNNYATITNEFKPGDEHDFEKVMEVIKRFKANIQLISKAEWKKIKDFM